MALTQDDIDQVQHMQPRRRRRVHPGLILVGALLVGFLLGMLLDRLVNL